MTTFKNWIEWALARLWAFLTHPGRRVGAGRHHETAAARWARLTAPLRRQLAPWRAERARVRVQLAELEAAVAWWNERRHDYRGVLEAAGAW